MTQPVGNARSTPCTGDSGAVLTEVAIVLVLFLVLTFSFFEGGRLLWSFTTLSNAVSEGTRYASVRSRQAQYLATETNIKTQVVNWGVGLGLSTADVTVTVVDSAGGTHGWTDTHAVGGVTIPWAQPGADVVVAAQYTYQPAIGLVPIGSFVMNTSSRMLLSR